MMVDDFDCGFRKKKAKLLIKKRSMVKKKVEKKGDKRKG